MSHDTHHKGPKEKQSIISFKNSFWLVVIIVGLFIAALNFVQAESGGEEHGATATEAQHEGTNAKEAHEAQPAAAAESEPKKMEEAKPADTPVKQAEGKEAK